MATHQQSLLSSASNKTNSVPPATSFTLITDEETVGGMPHAASAAEALDHVNAGSAAAASNFLQSNLCRVQTAMSTGAHNSIFHTSTSETDREPHPSSIPCTSDEGLSTSTHSSPRIHNICCSSKRTIDCAVPRQLRVAAPVDNELGSVVLQAGNGEHILSLIRTTRAHEEKSPSKKLNTSKEESTEKVEKADKKDIAEEAGEVDQAGEVEEEGCMTPTARDQRIPQYDVELNAECPPAPKKKPCTSKRRRLFNYSANIRPDAGTAAAGAENFNYHVVAERRAFLVDPPDLHNFPDCIRALFK